MSNVVRRYSAVIDTSTKCGHCRRHASAVRLKTIEGAATMATEPLCLTCVAEFYPKDAHDAAVNATAPVALPAPMGLHSKRERYGGTRQRQGNAARNGE